MPIFDRIKDIVARRLRRDTRIAWPSPTPPRRSAAGPTPLQILSEEVNERLRLAAEIADEAARIDIEAFCRAETLGHRQWYDTLDISPADMQTEAGIERALRYLELRRRVVRHPVQHHLVRMAR